MGACLLIYATRLERFREMDETPRLILAYTDPPKPKKGRMWIKLTVSMVVLSGIAAWTAFRLHRNPRPSVIATSHPRTENPAPSSAPSMPEPRAPRSDEQQKKTKAAPEKKTKIEQADETSFRKARAPLDIHVPSRSAATPPSDRPAVTHEAIIDDVRVRASEKLAGTLYLTMKLSAISKYAGTFTEKDLSSVRAVLEDTRKIKVFTGWNALAVGSKIRYSTGPIGGTAERTIYYFDPALDKACTSIQSLIANAMTQSEVPRRAKPEFCCDGAAGALSIGAFERSRWRLRRMRHLWVLNRL